MPARISPPPATAQKREREREQGESPHRLADRSAQRVRRGERLSADTEKVDAPHESLSLRPRSPRITIEARKAKPYLPSKSRPTENFNSAAEVGGAAIVCRHLSAEYALSSGKKSALLNAFSSVERIQAHFTPLGSAQNLDDRVCGVMLDALETPGSRHLISADNVGEYLAEIARQLDVSAESREANVLLATETHLMAAHIECKERKAHEPDAGALYFAVKFYEPNLTGNHVRMEVAQPDDLSHLSLPELQGVATCAGFTESDIVAVCQDVTLQLSAGRFASNLGPASFALAVAYDMPEVIDAISANLQAESDVKAAALLDQLLKVMTVNTPALYRSMADRENPVNSAAILRLVEEIGRAHV